MSDKMLHFDGFDEPFENWSKLPHSLIMALPIVSSLSELKVILYILRHTWGYKEYDLAKPITVDEFINGRKRKDGSRIDKGVGMSEPSIRSGLRTAAEHGFINIEVDEHDKARIEKSYKLIIHSSDAGVKSLPPEGKEFTPNPKTILPRSEKETLDEKPKKGFAAKPRKANPIFDLVAKHSFNITDTTKLEGNGGRIGKITAWLKKHDTNEENVTAFYLWYALETKGMSAPKDLDKFTEWYLQFEETLKLPATNIITFDLSKWVVPELEGVS